MYAYIADNEIKELFGSPPYNHNLVGFPPSCPDEVYAEYGIFPVTQANTPINDGYHNNELNYSVVDGLPISSYTIAELPIDECKVIKQQELEGQWETLICQGFFTSQTISGFEVDCRRNGADNDIQNIEGILGLYEAGVISEPIAWKGVSEVRMLTHIQLQELRIEMLGYGAQVYQRKFDALTALDSATTLEAIKSVAV